LLLCMGASAQQPLFHLRNGFWVNLHHFLYAQALANSGGTGRLSASAQSALQHGPCSTSSENDKVPLQPAIDFYAGHVSRGRIE